MTLKLNSSASKLLLIYTVFLQVSFYIFLDSTVILNRDKNQLNPALQEKRYLNEQIQNVS